MDQDSPFDDQCFAANTLSPILTQLNYRHCFLGGFALAILGSTRPTHDIDLLVETNELKEMREAVVAIDPQFESHLLRFSFLKAGNDPARTVLLETLRADNMGLPKVAGPLIVVRDLPILRPDILFLTKVKRWDGTLDDLKRAEEGSYPPRPATVRKFESDTSDLEWLLKYLVDQERVIVIEDHQGKLRVDFIKFMANFVKYETTKKNVFVVECLWIVLKEQDRKDVEAKM